MDISLVHYTIYVKFSSITGLKTDKKLDKGEFLRTTFKSGMEWTGNRNGRPKKSYCRDDFTDEIFFDRKEDIQIVAERLFIHAKDDKPWAIKLVLEYFLTRPKNKESAEQTANNKELVERLTTMPSAKLIAIHKMLSEEINSE